MSLPVRGTIRPRKDGKFDDRLAAAISERLIALEKASGGAAPSGPSFASPAAPAFGGGAPGAPGSPGAPGAPGATDHGALTGLHDNDHPQYIHRDEPLHAPPHTHRVADIADLNPDDDQFVTAQKVLGG